MPQSGFDLERRLNRPEPREGFPKLGEGKGLIEDPVHRLPTGIKLFGVRGDHENGLAGALAPYGKSQLLTVHLGHGEISNDQVKRLTQEDLQPFPAILSFSDAVAIKGEQHFDGFPDESLIVHQQNPLAPGTMWVHRTLSISITVYNRLRGSRFAAKLRICAAGRLTVPPNRLTCLRMREPRQQLNSEIAQPSGLQLQPASFDYLPAAGFFSTLGVSPGPTPEAKPGAVLNRSRSA